MRKKMQVRAIGLLMLLIAASACVTAYTAPVMQDGMVTFMFHAPEAVSVSIVGSFNRWQRDQDMLYGPNEKGWWNITLRLPPGRHEYLFLMNGSEWILDPHAQALVDDGLGGRNCIIVVGK